MTSIYDWATNKALDISAAEVRRWMGIETIEALVLIETRQISAKLDRLLEAPYKEALIYLRERDLDSCHKCIVSAIALDPLNLPARLLYAKILAYKKRFDVALEQYLEILNTFGFRSDLVPPNLCDAYAKKYFSSTVIGKKGFCFDLPDSFSDQSELWFSPSGFVLRFLPFRKGFFRPGPEIRAFRWNGQEIGSYDGDRTVAFISERLFGLTDSSDCEIYALNDGNLIKEVDSDDVQALFSPQAGLRRNFSMRRIKSNMLFGNALFVVPRMIPLVGRTLGPDLGAPRFEVSEFNCETHYLIGSRNQYSVVGAKFRSELPEFSKP
jgi:hypothetical protein